MTEHIHVAAGVILNGQQQVLLALRPQHKHQGGLWEFPGGKVETGESVRAALGRELNEELNIRVLEARAFLLVEHDYGDRKVTLDVWLVTSHSGEAHGREGQEIAWVSIADLPSYQFPDANVPIVSALGNLEAAAL